MRPVLPQDKLIWKAASAHSDYIYVNEDVASVTTAEENLARFRLTSKDPESLKNGAQVLGAWSLSSMVTCDGSKEVIWCEGVFFPTSAENLWGTFLYVAVSHNNGLNQTPHHHCRWYSPKINANRSHCQSVTIQPCQGEWYVNEIERSMWVESSFSMHVSRGGVYNALTGKAWLNTKGSTRRRLGMLNSVMDKHELMVKGWVNQSAAKMV